MRRVRDYAQVHSDGILTERIANAALELYEVDPLGLDRLDRGVLEALCRNFGGGPVGLTTLALSVAEEPETIEEVAEPFLVREGFLMRTPRGRVATARAWQHLGLRPPATFGANRCRAAGSVRSIRKAEPRRSSDVTWLVVSARLLPRLALVCRPPSNGKEVSDARTGLMIGMIALMFAVPSTSC